MPVVTTNDYNPGLVFRHRHINTMYPYLFRKFANIKFERNRFETSDDDFLDLDWLYGGNQRLAILCHGLEGSSESQYMNHTSSLLHKNNWDVLAMNYRSCSGELNRRPSMYHSGFTNDLHEILRTYASKYIEIVLIGFSLGGNMVLKYASDGIYTLADNIKKIVAISVPCDLSGGCQQLARWYNRPYENRFLKTLIKKMYQKHEQFPDVVSLEDIKKVHNVYTFDNFFTGPIHGFSDAEDYYSKSSSLQFLQNLEIPTLLLNAIDDPFLSESCFPFEKAKKSKYLYFKAPKFGGHLGFTTFGQSNYWNEFEILNFIN